VRHCHAGVQLLLRLVREFCRILERRRTFKSAISKCGRCRCFEGRKPDPALAPLPTDRLTEASVFKICGPNLCDRCFYVEMKSNIFEFFTCPVFRAVHLELITSVSTKPSCRPLEDLLLAEEEHPSSIGIMGLTLEEHGFVRNEWIWTWCLDIVLFK